MTDNSTPDSDNLMNKTFGDVMLHVILHYAVANIGKSDAEWAEERDKLTAAFRAALDNFRNKIRSEALSRMLRDNEKED